MKKKPLEEISEKLQLIDTDVRGIKTSNVRTYKWQQRIETDVDTMKGRLNHLMNSFASLVDHLVDLEEPAAKVVRGASIITKTDVMVDMKKCSRCLKEKPLSEFNKNKSSKDGYQSLCRTCAREYGLLKARIKKLEAQLHPHEVKEAE